MSSEIELNAAAARGARAEALLRNELLTDAFATLEQAYIAKWRTTTVDDVAAREKLFLAVNIVGKVQDHLASVVEDGKLAAAELRQITEAAERQKAWHEVR
ncbi:MAG TPA: hypothetical protein VFX37_15175 [Pseudolabrys sp.]|nr:hypothetical protein [Pseudolabrys sp.]